jgi:short-subunit dehydrogenase
MDNLKGRTAILTGASGGLGVYIAGALADLGMNLSLVAFPGIGLEELRNQVQAKGVKAIALPLDLRQDDALSATVTETRKAFGDVDVLVNNAGVEFTSAFHELSRERLADVLNVNLRAPMFLTHMVLPEMVRRKTGHIVNISSLAGKSFPGFQEPYAATKAGLVGFTFSLRGTYQGSGVSASVICPGFVEAGIYARLKQSTGFAAPAMLGTSPPAPVAKAVVRAIQKDIPEIIVNPLPVRPLIAITSLFPSVGEWMLTQIGAHKFFGRIAEAQKRLAAESDSAEQSERPRLRAV